MKNTPRNKRNSTFCFIVVDSNFNVLFWGKSAEEIFDLKQKTVLGRDLREVLLDLRAQDLLKAIKEGKRVVRLELQSKSLTLSVFSEKVFVGDEEYTVIFIEEVTEELERERIHELIMDNVRDLIALVDFDGRIRYISPSSEYVLGYNAEELIGRNMFDFVHPEDLELAKKVFHEAISGGGVGRLICRLRRKEGHYVWIEAIGRVISFKEKICVISARDVTETVTLENLLRVINNVGKVIVHAKDRDRLLNSVCAELASFFPAVSIWLSEEGGKIIKSCGEEIDVCNFAEEVVRRGEVVIEKCEVCGKRKAAFPMVTDGELKGVLIACLDPLQRLDEEEVKMLDVLANDVAFALKALELEEAKRRAYRQIEENIYRFAILVDEIKNPLMAIMGLAEEKIGDEEVRRKIIEQVERIRSIVKKLDEGWLESEKVREFLRKYL